MTYDPEPPRCCVCDARLNPYGGGPCCNGVRCKLEEEEQERADLEPKERPGGRFQVAANTISPKKGTIMAKKPLYALHKNADDKIITAGSFDYSYKLNDWLKSLDVRAGDKIEFGEVAERPDEQPDELKIVA